MNKFVRSRRKKRRVLPLSRQHSGFCGMAVRGEIPCTVTVLPSTSRVAPSARKQSMVAKISSLKSTSLIWLIPSDNPAQMSRRCAILLEGGAATVPHALPTFMRIFSILPHKECQLRAGSRQILHL